MGNLTSRAMRLIGVGIVTAAVGCSDSRTEPSTQAAARVFAATVAATATVAGDSLTGALASLSARREHGAPHERSVAA